MLFLGLCGRRIEEASGVKLTDLDENNVLHIRRIIYNGRVGELEKEQLLPLDQPEHAELVRRLRSLGRAMNGSSIPAREHPSAPVMHAVAIYIPPRKQLGSRSAAGMTSDIP